MIIRENYMNLFDVKQGYCLVHCISRDINFGAGIAKAIDEAYDMSDRIKKKYNVDTGRIIKVDNVYNLIVKEEARTQPTYGSILDALIELKSVIDISGVKKIAMPRIGCGKDKLNWEWVKEIIERVFSDVDIEILICYQ